MIEIKPIDQKFKNADAETRRQLWELSVAEALKLAVSNNELKERIDSIDANHLSLYSRVQKIEQELKDKVNKYEIPKKNWLAKLLGL